MGGFADRDKLGRFTSGAHDGLRDGCLNLIGWTADQIHIDAHNAQNLICPASPARASEAYNDYLGPVRTTPLDGGNPNRVFISYSICRERGVGGWTGTQVGDEFAAKGYRTNYMTTWFLSRQEVRAEQVGLIKRWSNVGGITPKGLNGAKGPLSRRALDTAMLPTGLVPLTGDANYGPRIGRSALQTIVDSAGQSFAQQGDPLAASFSDGPMARKTQTPWSQVASVDLYHIHTEERDHHLQGAERVLRSGAADAGAAVEHLQDYRALGPVHAGTANVLFAEGTVKSFRDRNGDGFLNPGFEGRAQLPSSPYVDDTIELPATEIFSGVLLHVFQRPRNFCEG